MTPTLPSPRAPARAALDPRLYQIAALAGLLIWGIARLGFDITPARALAVLGTALATQRVCTRLAGEPGFEPRSALISGLSLCLLLRTNSIALALAAPALAVASKFAIRVRGKHLFNPTNFALVALLLFSRGVWVSPGQWGNVAFFAFLIACVGGVVVQRAARADVTLAFLASYTAILFARALWLGQPAAIPIHQLSSGALLLFSFFMISDPRTTPDSRAGRVGFAVLVAAGAAFVPFVLYRTNGLLWSLAAAAPLVPLIDRILPGARHAWQPAPPLPHRQTKGVFYETPVSVPGLHPVRGPVRLARP